jgi:exonuclease SbcD
MSIVKFIHAADLHLGNTQYHNINRFRDFNKAFKWLLDKTIKEKADFLLIAGDFFHSSDVQPETLIIAYRYIMDFRQSTNNQIPIIVIEGNHDIKGYGMLRSWLQFLSETGFIILLNALYREDGNIEFPLFETKNLTGGLFQYKNVNIYGMNWQGSTTKEYFSKIKDAIKTDGFNILIMHFGLKGYLKKADGIDFDQKITILKDTVDYFALGHYHKQYAQDNWVYNPGSLEINEFTEATYPRGIFIVDILGNHEKKVSLFNEIPNRNFQIIDENIGVNSLPDFNAASNFIIEDLKHKLIPISTQILNDDDLQKPVLTLILKGDIHYSRVLMDTNNLKERIRSLFNVIDINLMNNCNSDIDGYSAETSDLEHLEDIEVTVLNSMVSEDNIYGSIAGKVVNYMQKIKSELLIKKNDPNKIAEAIELWWNQENIQQVVDDIKQKAISNKSEVLRVGTTLDQDSSIISRKSDQKKKEISENKPKSSRKKSTLDSFGK